MEQDKNTMDTPAAEATTEQSTDNNPAGTSLPPMVYDSDVSNITDIDDLIPDELKQAVKANAGDPPDDKSPEADPKEDDPKKEEVQDPKPGEDKPPEDKPPEDKPAESKDGIADDDLDVSVDAIDKLLEGDKDAVIKKAEPKKDSAPFWHEDEKYKDLTKRLGNLGIKPEEFDTIIQAATDKNTIDKGELVSGLEKKVEVAQRTVDNYTNEINRLKEIERSVMFDQDPITLEKFGTPMREAVNEMRQVLDREGLQVSLTNLLVAKNKAEFTKFLEDATLEDADLTKLTNHWRSYKDTETAYTAAKKEAQENLFKATSAKISPETVQSIMRTGLADVIKSDPKYGYIEDGIKEGVENNEEVSNVIGIANNNFNTIVNALASPSEYLHNQEWLEGVAKYSIDSAHNRLIQDKYYELAAEHDQAVTSLRKVVNAYRQLAASAKGIQGKGDGIAVQGSGANGGKSKEDVAEEFKSLLAGKTDISEIIPMGN